MLQTGKNMRLSFESFNSVDSLLLPQPSLAHLFDSYLAIAQCCIFCTVDRSHTTSSYRCKNAVALLEEVTRKQLPRFINTDGYTSTVQGVTTGTTECCL